jgi:BlaI family transcriptional regulator, penicillinase repressor
MARPKYEHPTPAELEILKILWDQGPATVREVWDVFQSRRIPRAYTSVMSLMNVMTEKRLLRRKPQGRAFLYAARVDRETALGGMLSDFLGRVFEGSSSSLVAHLLAQANPTDDELDAIRETIEAYREAEEDL